MNIDEVRRRWAELIREEESADATHFARAFHWLQTSHYVLNTNYGELAAIPGIFAKVQRLASQDHRQEREALHVEFIRRLHNYLASVKSLVDHTRCFRKRYVRDQGFEQECTAVLKTVRNDPVVEFLQVFRNPVLHLYLPKVSLTTTIPDGRVPRHQLTISTAELLAMHEWPAEARRYIEEAKEGYYEDKEYIDVMVAVERYQASITHFYEWFYKRVAEVKEQLIDEFSSRHNELVRLESVMHSSKQNVR